MVSLQGKTVLLTGSTGSLGSAIAKKLSSAGARIALSGTNQEKLNSLLEELGPTHSSFPCDLSKFDEIDNLSDNVIENFGSIDILINNAGITQDNLAIRMSLEEWQKVININLTSTFLMSKFAIK